MSNFLDLLDKVLSLLLNLESMGVLVKVHKIEAIASIKNRLYNIVIKICFLVLPFGSPNALNG